jgi:Rps23 Pro-64 3,4-dihydroxylase Tpa1-like proline 4-hydroxylase
MAAADSLSESVTSNYHEIRSVLPLKKMERNVGTWSQEYRDNQPYPHIGIDDFFDDNLIRELVADYPSASYHAWKRASFDPQYEEEKLSLDQIEHLPLSIQGVINALGSPLFLAFLERLTGIEGLIPDPYLSGGGLHMLPRGGRLGIHADFNVHRKLKLDRRLNLLLYLNYNWKPEWGGEIELWDREVKTRVKSYSPIANRIVIFSTTDAAFHGHPNPLECPRGTYRRSIALYYYTNGRPADERSGSHTTLFRSRPGEVNHLSRVRYVARQLTPPIIWELGRRFK